MQQMAKFKGEFEKVEIPTVEKMVNLSSILPTEIRNTTLAVFVEYDNKTYLANRTSMVPKSTKIVKTEAGQVCVIPAVTGG